MDKNVPFKEKFGSNLAELLSDKIQKVYTIFPKQIYVYTIQESEQCLTFSQRLNLHAQLLKKLLPKDFPTAIKLLLSILGDENPNTEGMFSIYYWILPIGKFVELYGLAHWDESLFAIEEITKRCTGEYAIRPFIRKYPQKTLERMKTWAKSENFHLRRLASEGLRPKLPWATYLDTFIHNPEPVFEILESLKEDNVLFVKKSVANHLRDWLKVNPKATLPLLQKWKLSDNRHTQWIIKKAIRNMEICNE